MIKSGRICKKAVYSALLFKKGRGDMGLVLSFHDRKGENGKCMNGFGKGNCPVGEKRLLILQTFAEKNSEERGLELENNMWIGEPLHYKGI